ncbi:MAG TPA: hypothetical protein VH560_18255 [Polyangia bacterium]|nr:hypothetical protein [Polyangia bacterium]
MRSKRWLGAVLGALVLAACSSPKSIVLLSLQSSTPTPIRGVKKVIVAVSQAQGNKLATLTYPPPKGTDTLTIDEENTTDLTVSFSGGVSGTVDLAVTVENTDGCTIGYGTAATVLRQAGIMTATATIVPAADCSTADGGTPDGSTPPKFPGCDPTTPMCAGDETCQVNCMTHMGECTVGGTGAPGSLCNSNADCAAGSQCFDYSKTGCGVKVCLRFCDTDNGCGTTSPSTKTSTTTSALSTPSDGGTDALSDGGADAPAPDGGDGGGPTGPVEAGVVATTSLCAGPVECDGVATAYHTCTFACDPRLISVKSGSRCPSGLSCLVVLGMDQVDCACPEATRLGTDGDTCTGSNQCAPGYICNIMGKTQQCRAVCGCNASGMTCTSPNECANGKACQTLTKDTIFGVCL